LGITPAFSKPVPLAYEHEVADFSAGAPVLDEWLNAKAMRNSQLLVSKTYVVCQLGTMRVAGFYSLSAGQLRRSVLSSKLRRNMPEDIPGIHLGRLAVDEDFQGQGLAGALLHDAVEKAKQVSLQIAARVLFVHALDQRAADFYTHFGFKRLPTSALTLALDLLEFGQ
jgi:GNAT superfamily N-acetyltransferase